jgi:hypothetical protein
MQQENQFILVLNLKKPQGWDHPQNMGPTMEQGPSLAPHFGSISHFWALCTIVKHEDLYMNPNMCRS